MQAKQFKDKYPIWEKTFSKQTCRFKSTEEFLNYFQVKIETHDRAVFIARFDHFKHTKTVDGTIANNITDAQNIIFCFGWEIPSADPIAVRPRSIGITEQQDNFVVNFMEAPNPVAQEIMINWVKDIA